MADGCSLGREPQATEEPHSGHGEKQRVKAADSLRVEGRQPA